MTTPSCWGRTSRRRCSPEATNNGIAEASASGTSGTCLGLPVDFRLLGVKRTSLAWLSKGRLLTVDGLVKRTNLKIQQRPVLFRLDGRELDHLRPLFGGFGDDRRELGRRAPKHGAAQLDDPRLDFGIGETGIELLVQ